MWITINSYSLSSRLVGRLHEISVMHEMHACMHVCLAQKEHLNDLGGGSTSVRSDHLWCCIREAEAQPGILARASYAAKVDDSPSVLSWQPHHIAGLKVAVHIAQFMEVPQAQCQLVHHLRMHDVLAVAWTEFK
jgi:hypothetical protein